MTVALLILLTISCLLVFTKGSLYASFDQKHTLPLRGILAILVVLGHLDTVVAGQTKILTLLHMATPAVAVFFFMSGYGLMLSYFKKGDNYLHRFITKSSIKLLIPLILTTLLYQSILLILGKFSWSRIADDFITGVEMPLVHSWYVYALFFFYLFFFIVFKYVNINNSIKGKLLILILLMLSYYVLVRYCLGWGFFWWITCMAFPIGFIYSYYEDKIKHFAYTNFWLVPLIILVLLIIKFLSNVYAPICGELPYILLGPIVALILCKSPLPIDNKFLNFLGTISFEIYLAHGIFEKLLVGIIDEPYLYIIVVISATIGMAWFLHVVFKMIINFLLK